MYIRRTTVVKAGKTHVHWRLVRSVRCGRKVRQEVVANLGELDVAEDWFRSTALDDLLGVPVAAVNDDRCCLGLDRLLAFKEQLATHVKDRLGTLFSLDYDLLLYDVTSTYFEGKAEGNALAATGHSRDHRPDCKQVCIGLMVTREGYPLGFEVFAGNRNDSTTLEEVVDRMESRYGKASRVWGLDRGMVSEKHLAWLRKRGSRYVVGTPKSQLTKFSYRMLSQDWEQVREGLAVRKTKPDGAEPGGEFAHQGGFACLLARVGAKAAPWTAAVGSDSSRTIRTIGKPSPAFCCVGCG